MLRAFDHHPATGRLVLQCASFAGDTWLRIVDGRGRTVDKIPPHDLPVHARWSPDGSALTYGTNDGRILVHDLATRTSRLVFGDAEYQAGFSEWSPDGRHLAFTAHRRPSERVSDKCPPDVYHCTVATGEVCRLTDAPDASDRFPNWSPDGTRIAFHRQDLGEPGTPKRVHLVRVGGGGEAAFSPADDRLLCVLEDEIVWVRWPEVRPTSRLRLDFGTGIRGSPTGLQTAFGAQPGEVWFLGEDSRLYRWDGADACTVVAEQTDDTRPSCPRGGVHRARRRRPGATRPAADPRGSRLCCRLVRPWWPRRDTRCRRFLGVAACRERLRGGPRRLPGVIRLRGTPQDGEHRVLRRLRRARRHRRRCAVAGFLRPRSSAGAVRRQLRRLSEPHGARAERLSVFLCDLLSCAICTCPAINMPTHPLHRDRALPADPERRRQALQDRSVFAATAHIRRPVLLFHGALDTVATTQQMRELAKQISAAGGPCDLVVFEDDTHSLARHRSEVRRRSERFLAQLAMH